MNAMSISGVVKDEARVYNLRDSNLKFVSFLVESPPSGNRDLPLSIMVRVPFSGTEEEAGNLVHANDQVFVSGVYTKEKFKGRDGQEKSSFSLRCAPDAVHVFEPTGYGSPRKGEENIVF